MGILITKIIILIGDTLALKKKLITKKPQWLTDGDRSLNELPESDVYIIGLLSLYITTTERGGNCIVWSYCLVLLNSILF